MSQRRCTLSNHCGSASSCTCSYGGSGCPSSGTDSRRSSGQASSPTDLNRQNGPHLSGKSRWCE